MRVIPGLRFAAVVALSLLAACDRSSPRPPATDAERIAAQAYGTLLIREAQVERDLAELASASLEVTRIPGLLQTMCERQCESAYLRCVINSVRVEIDIPGRNERPPKDFGIEIPDIEVDESGNPGAVTVGPESANCEAIRTACLQGCACRTVRTDSAAAVLPPRATPR